MLINFFLFHLFENVNTPMHRKINTNQISEMENKNKRFCLFIKEISFGGPKHGDNN